jgi:hypothetical protein
MVEIAKVWPFFKCLEPSCGEGPFFDGIGSRKQSAVGEKWVGVAPLFKKP